MIGTINKILKKILGDKSKEDLKDINPIVEQVKQIGQNLTSLSHDDLRNKTEKLKELIKTRIAAKEEEVADLKIQAEALPGTELEQKEAIFAEIDKLEKETDKQIEEVLTEILPEAFAIVRETARRLKENSELRLTASEFDRQLATTSSKDYITIEGNTAIWKNNWIAAGNRTTWEMVHYDVQLIGGIALHRGKVAEMATGEGKTLVATLPVFLNALAGRGATPNGWARSMSFMVYLLTVSINTSPIVLLAAMLIAPTLRLEPTTNSASITCATIWRLKLRNSCNANITSPLWMKLTACLSMRLERHLSFQVQHPRGMTRNSMPSSPGCNCS